VVDSAADTDALVADTVLVKLDVVVVAAAAAFPFGVALLTSPALACSRSSTS